MDVNASFTSRELRKLMHRAGYLASSYPNPYWKKPLQQISNGAKKLLRVIELWEKESVETTGHKPQKVTMRMLPSSIGEDEEIVIRKKKKGKRNGQ